MTKTLYLHIGAGKTGTSSIQATLGQNWHRLKSEGVWVVPWVLGVLAEAVSDPARLAPVQGFDPEKLRAVRARAPRSLTRWKTRAPAPTAVISSEHFHGINLAEKRRLQAYLAALADRVVIVCYVRHPLSKMVAMGAQRVRDGYGRLAQQDRWRIDRMDLDLPEWSAVFGAENLLVRKFERGALWQDSPFADFCQAIGHPGVALRIQPVERNWGLSRAALYLADALAETAPAGSPVRGPSDWLAEIPGPGLAITQAMIDAHAGDLRRQLTF